jgi:gamma-glutamyltranspeptidase / glutathione hydrolase
LRRLVFICLVFGLLTSCGAQSIASNSASSKDAVVEETTSLEESQGGEEVITEPASSTPSVTTTSISEPTRNTSTSPATGTSGMVSSANPLATEAGLDVLAEGGNAFDAAVTVGAALNVVEPMMSGIGGYGAIVVYDAKKSETWFLDSGSRTPAALDPSAFRSPTSNFAQNRCGAKAVTTPGNVDAWEALSKDYGELEWRRLFDPAIELAEGGFAVGGITAGWIDASFSYFPEHAKSIYGNNGTPLRAGELLVQKDLANSLGLIAEQGASAVREGELARAIDAAMRENGGFLTIDDLRSNRAAWRNTTSSNHQGYEVVTASPPATSWGALLRLGMMDQFSPATFYHNSAQYLHTFAEVTKQASVATRNYVSGDPETQATPLDLLLSEEFWASEAAKIDSSRASPSVPFGQFGTPTNCPPQSYTSTGSTAAQGHTTHFVVADEEGNVVSATQTLGNIFGSKVMPEGTGIWLNDSIAWSRFEPAGNPFDAFPGRLRPVALGPTIIMSDGEPWAAIGTPGGRTILQTTPQMLVSLIDFDMDVQQAISAPRISTISPNALLVERSIPQSVRNQLSALGHNVRVEERGLGNAHGLTVEYNARGEPVWFTGGADPRGEGAAAGR